MSNRLLLIVDDEQPVRAYVAAILQRDGFKVLEAADGGSAFAQVERLRERLSLIVTDWQMPGMNGTDFVAQVRAKYPRIPVVFISGYPFSLRSQRLNKAGARSAFVGKPFSPTQLLQAVHRIIPSR